jgi:hypothetical protein
MAPANGASDERYAIKFTKILPHEPLASHAGWDHGDDGHGVLNLLT